MASLAGGNQAPLPSMDRSQKPGVCVYSQETEPFYTCFHFSISYQPGSRIIKPNTLSYQFQEREDATPGHTPILPARCMVTTLTWKIEERVRSTVEEQAGPSDYPPYRLFVPLALRPNTDSTSGGLLSMRMSGASSMPILSATKTSHGSCRFPTFPPSLSSSLVAHFSGLHHWPPSFRG